MRSLKLAVFALFLATSGSTGLEDAAFWDRVATQELHSALRVSVNERRARNVVLFVGDGMGPNTITAARIYKGQLAGEGRDAERGLLAFERFPHVALLKTYNTDKQVSDSASTATALFSGVKSNYKTVGLDANVKLGDCESSLNKSYRADSILKWAQDAGKLTGFVTNTRLTHATPAALYAHSAHRSWECEAKMPRSAAKCKDIARQMVEDEPGKSINVILGGGRQCLVSNVTITAKDPIDTWACRRGDRLDLIRMWEEEKRAKGVSHSVVSKNKELTEVDFEKTDFLLGVFTNGFLQYEHERDAEISPSLAEMTVAAIKTLNKGPNGFILVVESGMIDQAHHRGTARKALDETVALEKAVEEALKLVDLNETLVIVTADHTHTLSIAGYPVRGTSIMGIAYKSKSDALNYTTLSYATGTEIKFYPFNATHVTRPDPSTEDVESFEYKQHSAISTDEGVHGGGEVTAYAIGPWSHLFQSVHEQNYVAHVVGFASKIGNYEVATNGAATMELVTMSAVLICLLFN
ncbi:alkaline phosphatase, tissue-nonspecific isozyme-like [Neocloeon triangulifer]|uniref:alkaline phosphatase, tissue-nonspecific isozyme-like n=1 Tax=Neocloeon triangulifer TaxID=2078957 RepID=UPI00286ED9BB|nr:alkaline phosphatase, tissue-nonspecific isozyme-like [Neocloeon triangulifer]XP_059479348.1 alkaline phosphatase, tissue-nonspecific isozyme-like [Neocloeon triangulifer]